MKILLHFIMIVSILQLIFNIIYIYSNCNLNCNAYLNIISNCLLSNVIEFSKELHCSREIITVSVATGTTLSSPQATDNFIMYKPSLLQHFLLVEQTPEERVARLKGPVRKAKVPVGSLRWKMAQSLEGNPTSSPSIPSRCPSLPITVRDYVRDSENVKLHIKGCVIRWYMNEVEMYFKLKI